jgi:prepilin-type N-terminal cleavage/methylation domain-containing protein
MKLQMRRLTIADRADEAGFSLLEVMVALGVLAMSLVVLAQITTSNLRATHHAKMLTTATFLARAKMSDMEDVILVDGFVDTDQEDAGDFSASSRPEFRWKTLIEKIELPPDLAQKAQDQNQANMEENSSNPLAAMSGLMGGFMTTLIEPIRVGIEESVRRVSVEVFWSEPGRLEQSFKVDTFMTDPAKLDLAVAAIGQPPGGNNTGGAGGASGTGVGGATGSAGAGAGARPPGGAAAATGSGARR